MANETISALLYYVYALFDWRGTVFYIGKGKGYRAWAHAFKPPTSDRNRHRQNVVLKTIRILGSCPTVIIREGLSEAAAFETEIALIKAIGRRDLGLGPLLNLTNGGEGTSGCKLTEDGRRRISEKNKLNAQSRPPVSDITRAKLSAKSSNPSLETSAKFSEIMRRRWAEGTVPPHPSRKGCVFGPETRERMRIGALRRWANASPAERMAENERLNKALREAREQKKKAKQAPMIPGLLGEVD